MQSANPEAVEQVIGAALSISAEQGLDTAMFSTNAAVPGTSPAGLLHGITPIIGGGIQGAQGIADDIAALAGQIGANGINADNMVVVTTPALAAKLRILASPKFENPVLSSAYLATGIVIGVVPAGLASAYAGSVSIESSLAASVHLEDTTPLPIIGGTGAMAAPVSSAFQQHLVILKIRARATWCCQQGAIAVLEGAVW